MPTGGGATSVVNDPRTSALAFAADPQAFFEQTERNEYTALSFSAPGSGATERKQLPQNGILSKITVMFEGTLDVTLGAGTVTTAGRWPYGLIEQLVVSANAQNDLVSVNGDDLLALATIRNPGSFANDTVDTYPGGIGAGNAVAADGTVALTWEIPIAIDDVTLVGALYAQSPSMNLMLAIREAVHTDLLVAAGGATYTLTGTFYVMVTSFDIPIQGGAKGGALIVPDLSRLHGINAHTVPVTAVGENRAPLVRSNGQLDRLLFQVTKSAPEASTSNQLLSLDADAASTLALDAVRLEYGSAQRPLDYNPGQSLAKRNLNDYGDALPEGYYCLDFIAENPPRDVVVMMGVTDLVLVATVGSGVTVAASAKTRLVQETLFG